MDVHDLLEARYHLIRGGELTTAGHVTEWICSQLDTWGAWDQEASLVVDTLTLLPEDSPRRPAWIHQLGILAHNRRDYAEADRRYRKALDINERLGNQAGMARTLSQIGILLTKTGHLQEAILNNLQSLAIRQHLESPQAEINLRTLLVQRQQLGDSRFKQVLHEHLDEASVGSLLALLDQFATD